MPHEARHWREMVLARLLAADAAYDLHELLNLVDRGCPPILAARILAPR
ncbi:MAG: hypothetical protein M3320_01185 [Actinomycetota bacterium]|nr:hypothetical protein [Actinomycetota bacterium]